MSDKKNPRVPISDAEAMAHAKKHFGHLARKPEILSDYPIDIPFGLDPDTAALVLRFSEALAEKLRAAEQKYGYDNGWLQDGWESQCRAHLYDHLAKGDPRDVANYCAFMWHHGWSTAPVPESQPINAAPASDTPRRHRPAIGAMPGEWRDYASQLESDLAAAHDHISKDDKEIEQLKRELAAHEAVRDACFEALGPECRVWGDVPGHIEQLGREAEIFRIERDQAREQRETVIQQLTGIFALLDPPDVQANGKTMRFVNPNAAEVLHELSERIRAIPEDMRGAVSATQRPVASRYALKTADGQEVGYGYSDDPERGAEKLYAAPVSTSGLSPWVLVEDRLPDNGDPVVVFEGNASHMRRLAYYDTIGATGWHWCGYEGECNPDAWMPIPMFSRVQSATQERKDG